MLINLDENALECSRHAIAMLQEERGPAFDAAMSRIGNSPMWYKWVMHRVGRYLQCNDAPKGVSPDCFCKIKQSVERCSWLRAYGRVAAAEHEDRDALLAYFGADAQPVIPSTADIGSLATGWHRWEDPDRLYWLVGEHALKHVDFSTFTKYQMPEGMNKRMVRVVVHANLNRIYLFNDGLYFHPEQVGDQVSQLINLLAEDGIRDLRQVGQGLARLQQEIADYYQTNKTT